MQFLIEDLKSIPGVVGACSYQPQKGILANNLPSIFREDGLQDTAKQLAKIHAAGRLNFPDLKEIMLNYDESIILFRQIGTQDHLITICDPSINMNLLSMSLNLDIENRKDTSQSGAAAIPVQLGTRRLLEKGPMAQTLRTMKELLIKVIGPMGDIIFDDSLDNWVRRNGARKGSLSSLLEVICNDIGDPEKGKEYRILIKQRLSNKSKENTGRA
ncbi:MAG: hypothetical protein C0614_03890 [Desulfuromonas sp.]|nr:MAG: hypothetical protein C0614_03890 [Desulfuromonas sp.]